jgi:hypothetical protein
MVREALYDIFFQTKNIQLDKTSGFNQNLLGQGKLGDSAILSREKVF